MEIKKILELTINAAIDAGKKILEVYNTDFGVEIKDDKSPLTLADKKSNEVIVEYLNNTEIPILSEEGKNIEYSQRKEWTKFWLIDPLDGTKEFIKRNGEFTVNIALIENNTPTLGVIYVPVLKTLYFAQQDIGSFKIENIENQINNIDDLIKKASRLPLDIKTSKLTVVGSKSHMNEDTQAFINTLEEKHGEIEMISRGSSIKLCMVAEGQAAIYPRYAPTMEWDTGAGHAIAKFAGAKVLQANTDNEMVYNKEDLLNPWFIVSRV